MAAQSVLMMFLEGLTGLEQAKTLLLDEETINFYPSKDGYLQNYPGRANYFDNLKGDSPINNGWGTPPTLTKVTRVTSFVDYLHVEHLVIVNGMDIHEVIGNSSTIIYTLVGRDICGDAYPDFFIHESKLIILNEGDVPLIWDGVDGVTPLGVPEVPPPPVMIEVRNILAASFTAFDPYDDAYVWYHSVDGPNPGAPGPTLRVDSGGTGIQGWYDGMVQYGDKYGNKGAASSSSGISSTAAASSSNANNYDGLLAEWVPPRKDEHIHFVYFGRTANMNHKDVNGGASRSVFYLEQTFEGTTQHRHYCRDTDATLLGKPLMDLTVRAPPSGRMGASFGRRTYIVDQDGVVWYSDLVYFGQFRATQQFMTYSQPRAIIPAGDRLFFVCESSTEVWYESSAGPALLEQDIEQGSRYGSTFVAVGDGVIFGLWNEGFGFYDGREHKYISAPYYLEKYYVGEAVEGAQSAIKIKEWYYLTIRRDQISDNNNVILMYNFRTGKWYVVEETVNDIAFWNEEIVGVDSTLHILYRGGTFPASVVQTAGIVAGEIIKSRTLSNVRILMEPSANVSMTLSVRGEEHSSKETGSGFAHPDKNASMSSRAPMAYWGDNADAPYSYGEDWQVPGDVFLRFKHTKPVVGFYHRVTASFIAGQSVRIKALELTYSIPSVAEGR